MNQIQKYNQIMFLSGGRGLDTKTIPVIHDTKEYKII